MDRHSGFTLGCVDQLVRGVPRLEPQHKQLFFLYYQPLLMLIVMLALWGVNLAVWARLKLHPSPLVRLCHLPHSLRKAS